MTVNEETVKCYWDESADLIPLNPWNKQRIVKGNVKKEGKAPFHQGWPSRAYTPDEVKGYLSRGHNVGYRISASEVIVDIDPRNAGGVDISTLVAEAFGYFDFDELCEEQRVVATGGGGWHIYCTLQPPTMAAIASGEIHLKEVVEDYPGVEFKRRGKQVVAAGSKHPDGPHYEWLSTATPKMLPDNIIEALQSPVVTGDYVSGSGALTGPQLESLILDKLDPNDFSDNDRWFPILCGSHHVTGGDGVDEFISWSLGDPSYSDCEGQIRQRWESLKDKPSSATIGTLIHALQQHGEDTSGIRAVLDFADIDEVDDDTQEAIDTDAEEGGQIAKAMAVADDICIEDIYHVDADDEPGVEGRALVLANEMCAASNDADITRCLRLIKAAGKIEAARALEVLATNTKIKKAALNSVLKSLDDQINDDIARIIADKSLDSIFNNKKHLMQTPNGQLWGYTKTHWTPINEDYLGHLLTKVYDKLRLKMEIKAQENSLINQAVAISKRQVSTLTNRLFRPGTPLPVINCKNGELWVKADGSHVLKPHRYKSYLLNCLDVDYTPGADCPLFKRTLAEIFGQYPDTEEMVAYIAEVMGYCIQPFKNIAAWWLFRGPGGDGKSTLIKIMGGILGDAQLMTNVRLLKAGSHDGYNHALTSLVGKLNVVIEELPAGTLLSDAGVKMLAESTKMEANPKSKDAFNFSYSGSLIMCSNGFPATRDLSHGMQRRANVIPFNRQFTKGGHEDIDRAADILGDKQEMAGVLNFMLEGLQRLRSRGRFNPPETCMAAKEEWFRAANPVVRFLHEQVEMTNNHKDTVWYSEFVENYYRPWCEINDVKAKGRNSLSQDLDHLGIDLHKSSGRGLRLFGVKMQSLPGREDAEDDFKDI